MRIVVMGAGGVGGYYGGRLAQAGEDVWFVARGRHLAALRERGLRVRSTKGDFELHPVQATDDPGTIPTPVDLVLFCVKSWDTEAAAAAIRPIVGPETGVLTLQNGVENEDRLAAVFGAERVLAGTTQIETTIAEPGLIAHTSPFAKIRFGEWTDGRSPRVVRILAAFERAGVDAEIVDDSRRALWEKFLFLAATAGLTSLTRGTVGEVRGHPLTRELLVEALAEIGAVARARGIALPPDAEAKALAFIDSVPFGMKSSMQRDLERGSRLEVDALSGAVVRLGREHGVPTPVHFTIYAALALADAKNRGLPIGQAGGS